MQLDWQSRRLRSPEHACRLLGRECNILAEGIDRISELVPSDSRDHRTDLVDILLLVAVRFWRQCVRAEKARHDFNLTLSRQPARNAEHPNFGFAIEAIARLDFDGCHTFGKKTVEPRQRCRNEIVFARRTCRLHCRHDAAACLRDLFV